MYCMALLSWFTTDETFLLLFETLTPSDRLPADNFDCQWVTSIFLIIVFTDVVNICKGKEMSHQKIQTT